MLNDLKQVEIQLSVGISTIFLMSVLVLGVISYPSALPYLDQDIAGFDFQLQLANVAFADDEEEDEEDEEDGDDENGLEDEKDENGSEDEKDENGSEDEKDENGLEDEKDENGSSGDDDKFELEAELVDPSTGEDGGKAKFEERSDRTRFSVEIEDQAADAMFVIVLSSSTFSISTNEFGFGDFNLDSRDGDDVPSVEDDDDIDIEDSLGNVVLSGTFSPDEEEEEEEELEGVIVSVNPDGSFTIETEDGTFTIFTDADTKFDDFDSLDSILGFGVEVEVVLSNSSLVATEIEIEEEIEIEVEVEHGVAKVKVEFDDQKTRFVIDFIDEDLLADAILLEVPDLPLTTSQIMSIWDLDIEEYDEDEEMSSITMHEHEQEAIQTALDLIYELQQKIEQLEDRIQTLLEKLDSGEYFGTVPEVDSVIKSYIISFEGSATSIDDESIVDAEGEIFIENLLTINDNISKFRVTGGEISIDNTFYDLVFGKARVSSGPSGEKDIVVLLGQVIDFADEDDDSSTLKLVINSETSLEGDFGLVPISIEILPQSKIAGQWYLSGSGQLSLLEG